MGLLIKKTVQTFETYNEKKTFHGFTRKVSFEVRGGFEPPSTVLQTGA